MLWRISWVVETIWTCWSRISPASSLESWSFWPMESIACTLMAQCCVFSGPAGDRGLRRGYRPVGVSGSGIASMWPWRSAWQKAVRRKIFFPKYVRAQSAWSAVVLHVLRNMWREGGRSDRMFIPSTAISVRITYWDVGGSQSQPRVSLSTLRWSATTGRRASAFASALRLHWGIPWDYSDTVVYYCGGWNVVSDGGPPTGGTSCVRTYQLAARVVMSTLTVLWVRPPEGTQGRCRSWLQFQLLCRAPLRLLLTLLSLSTFCFHCWTRCLHTHPYLLDFSLPHDCESFPQKSSRYPLPRFLHWWQRPS